MARARLVDSSSATALRAILVKQFCMVCTSLICGYRPILFIRVGLLNFLTGGCAFINVAPCEKIPDQAKGLLRKFLMGIVAAVGDHDQLRIYRVSLTNGFPLAGFFYNATYGRSTPEYATISLKPFDNRPLQNLSGSIGIGGNQWGSISLFGSLREASIDNSLLTTVGVRYSVPVFKSANLAANVSRTQGQGKTEWTSGLTLTSYLGTASTASVTAQNSGGIASLNANLQKTPESEQGLGYHVSGQLQES